MMLSKSEVDKKLNELVEYSKTQQPEYAVYFEELMAPLRSEVEKYFTTVDPGLEKALRDCVFYVFDDMFRRGFERRRKFGKPLPTNFPPRYSDIRKCFYTFPILEISNEEFHAAWVIGTPEQPEETSMSDEGGVEPEPPRPLSNSIIDSEFEGVKAAPANDTKNVIALSRWCQNAGSQCGMISLLEDEGKVLKSPNRKEIALNIYYDKGMLDIVTSKNLNVYIPSYVSARGYYAHLEKIESSGFVQARNFNNESG